MPCTHENHHFEVIHTYLGEVSPKNIIETNCQCTHCSEVYPVQIDPETRLIFFDGIFYSVITPPGRSEWAEVYQGGKREPIGFGTFDDCEWYFTPYNGVKVWENENIFQAALALILGEKNKE